MAPLIALVCTGIAFWMRDILFNVRWNTLWVRLNIITILILIFTAVSSWIIGIQMKKRIRKDLGRKPTELDLTSIDTWMKVDEEEHEHKRNDSIDPG
jgi:hypothetical protein